MATALVLGGASCLWSDVASALELGEYFGCVACNEAAAYWPGPLDAAVSYHPVKWPFWLELRRRRGLEPPARVYGHLESGWALGRARFERIEARFPGQTTCGTSGLFALKVALHDLGFERAVLCGVPMDAQPHFFESGAWGDARVHRPGWLEALPYITGRARSMRGWTADLLGRPDVDWLS